MAIRTNPFVGRASESTTPDHEFASLFCSDILDKVNNEAFEGAVHIFTSPPGGGKTTLLRAFTPTSVRTFWNLKSVPEIKEAYQKLVDRRVIDPNLGPQFLGIYLSCAAGYADLPAALSEANDGAFRALLNCRIVLKTIKSLAAFLNCSNIDQLSNIKLNYDELNIDFVDIPTGKEILDLYDWAIGIEKNIYSQINAFDSENGAPAPSHVRFEGVLWLHAVQFQINGQLIGPRRLLMIDDLHTLKRRQSDLLIKELIEIRSRIPVWLAMRSSAFASQLLAPGARPDRDAFFYDLGQLWNSTRGTSQFQNFAQSVLNRRLAAQPQRTIMGNNFAAFLRSAINPNEVASEVALGIAEFRKATEKHSTNALYATWLSKANALLATPNHETLKELFATLILIARNEGKKQYSLDLVPLTIEDHEYRESSQVFAAAELFAHEYFKIPYYFGIERLCTMASDNVEELLGLASGLYDELCSKQIIGSAELELSPAAQEQIFKDYIKKRFNFIPKSVSEGSKAQTLLNSVGQFCRQKTFEPNAPIAPGVTGFRLRTSELDLVRANRTQMKTLRSILEDCVAGNLLITRESQASTSRDAGTIFYLNRALCTHFNLPLQMGGWQDVTCSTLVEWFETGLKPIKLEFR